MEKKNSKKVIVIVVLLLIVTLVVAGIVLLPKLLNKNNIASKQQVILYNGLEMQPIVGVQYISDMQKNEEANNKYNTTYYNYEKGAYQGTTQGSFGEETYEGYSVVQNVKKIAITQQYNAIPRNYTKTNRLPSQLKDLKQYSDFNVQTIDLDGDTKMETLVSYNMGTKQENGKTIYESAISLYDSEYSKIADLVKMKDDIQATPITLDNVEYFDIDNDGIMEIIIDIPTHEGTKISVLKYNKGVLEGEKNIVAHPTRESAETINEGEISEELKFFLNDVTYFNAIQDEEIYKHGNVDSEDFYKAVKLNVAFNCINNGNEEQTENSNQLIGKDKTSVHKAIKEAFGEDVTDVIKSNTALQEYVSSRDEYVYKEAGDSTFSVYLVKIEQQNITDEELEITYIYAYPSEGDLIDNNIGDYDCYRTTLKLKINKDYKYSKYQLLDKLPLKDELVGKIKDLL